MYCAATSRNLPDSAWLALASWNWIVDSTYWRLSGFSAL